VPEEVLQFAYFLIKSYRRSRSEALCARRKEVYPQDQDKANAPGQANSQEGLIPGKETREEAESDC
jgi:hypothetical protein